MIIKKDTLVKTTVATVLGILITLIPSGAYGAQNTTKFVDDVKSGVDDVDNGSTGVNITSLLQTLINTLLFLVGAISVIMVIVGGIRFVISRGDQQAVADARNTVLYAIIGIVVAVTAYGVINYVLGIIYPPVSIPELI